MSDVYKFFSDLIKNSVQNYQKKVAPTAWKDCIALQEDGWEVESAKKDEEDGTLVVNWKKEGVDSVSVKLSHHDQKMWIKALGKKKERLL